MNNIARGVYVETRYRGGNIGFIVTGSGVVCVDMPMAPGDVRRWLAQIRKVTKERIRFVVQTDYDPGRIASTSLIDAPIIAHDAAWDKMKRYQREKQIRRIQALLGHLSDDLVWQVRMPEITFSEQFVLEMERKQVHILHAGGHSVATCMVYLPQDRLVFTGDLVFNNMYPTMTQAQSKQWLSALNKLRKMAVDVIVPGHGAVCDKTPTRPLSHYLREVRARVRTGFQAGRSKPETSKAVIPELMKAFPYKRNETPGIQQRVKEASYRVYDEYRAASRASGKKKRRKKRKKRGHIKKR